VRGLLIALLVLVTDDVFGNSLGGGMQMSQHCPAKRIGLGQSAGGQMTWSHCAMADCDWEGKIRSTTAANMMAEFFAVEGLQLIISYNC
jgi:hypothetical protein